MPKSLQQNTKKLGAHWTGENTNFSLYSENADAVDLCLFDKFGNEIKKIKLQKSGNYWFADAVNVKPGQLYGYRVYGDYEPKQGHRFNPNKLLIDPYAKSIAGQFTWHPDIYAYDKKSINKISNKDNAAYMPKSVVVDDHFEWQDDKLLNIPLDQTIVYEMHVKGFTKLHPEVPLEHRGKYLGLTAPAVIDYLHSLGVTTLELLPCMASITDERLHKLQLHNYWGYDPISFFAPDARFAIKDASLEFKQMVKALHKAGFEVIMDVVYNHTGEGGEYGPTISLRGIDNSTYYRLNTKNFSQYDDTTGCGNSLNTTHPITVQLIIDSLRYWVTEMHVDGFRFDLATTVARSNDGYDKEHDFLEIIAADPVLSKVKLIAEPWDLGWGGYQLGNFPLGWSEWNDQYRDTVRAFWRGDENKLSNFVARFSGSGNIFRTSNRGPLASVNFVTAHDGFTLSDLVSYSEKHNEINGENNRDGHSHNISANYGVEGPTEDKKILVLRAQQQRNILATLFLSQGIPMLLAGDEANRTQQGNNNGYCQDNEITWHNWQLTATDQSLLNFTQLLIHLRKKYSIFRQTNFLEGELYPDLGYRDVEWIRPDGLPMSKEDWHKHYARCVTVLLVSNPNTRSETDQYGHFLLIFNASEESVECFVPAPPESGEWELLFDTSIWPTKKSKKIGRYYSVDSRSVILLQERNKG